MADAVAAEIIREFVWEAIKANTGASESNYKGLVPIVPFGVEPELVEFTDPYIVYGFVEQGSPSGHEIVDGTISFVVYHKTVSVINRWISVITRFLEREDATARDLNALSSSRLSGSRKNDFKGVRFTTVSFAMMEAGEPQETEDGRQSASATFSYQYVIDSDIKLPSVTSSGNVTWS